MTEAEFWSNKRETESGCWEWSLSKTPLGYGCAWFNGRLWRAHRLAWTLAIGSIAPGIKILHKCDNRGCFRPDHLFDGSQVTNMQDCAAKGRIGGGAPGGRLTPSIVRFLRSWKGIFTEREFSSFFGVTKENIAKAQRRVTYKGVA